MKQFISALLICLGILKCSGQDTLVTKRGEEIQSIILEVGVSEIKYKKFDNQNGPTFSILKLDVASIRYQNGTKDVFDEVPIVTEDYSSSIPSAAPPTYMQGVADAKKYYKGYKPAGTTTLIVSLISPLIGLIPAIACSSIKPKEINLHYPVPELMKTPDYFRGYAQQAKKTKQGKVWRNWGIALGLNIVVAIAVTQ